MFIAINTKTMKVIVVAPTVQQAHSHCLKSSSISNFQIIAPSYQFGAYHPSEIQTMYINLLGQPLPANPSRYVLVTAINKALALLAMDITPLDKLPEIPDESALPTTTPDEEPAAPVPTAKKKTVVKEPKAPAKEPKPPRPVGEITRPKTGKTAEIWNLLDSYLETNPRDKKAAALWLVETYGFNKSTVGVQTGKYFKFNV